MGKIDDALATATKAIIKHEGFRENAYKDQVGVVTIGYGFTKAVIPNLKMGDKISRQEADALLQKTLYTQYAKPVNDAIKPDVMANPKLTSNMLAALYSLSYNVGPGVANHNVIKAVNALDFAKAESLFEQYNKGTDRSTGQKVTVPALVKRRMEEMALFRTPVAVAAIGGTTLILLGVGGYFLWKYLQGRQQPAYA